MADLERRGSSPAGSFQFWPETCCELGDEFIGGAVEGLVDEDIFPAIPCLPMTWIWRGMSRSSITVIARSMQSRGWRRCRWSWFRAGGQRSADCPSEKGLRICLVSAIRSSGEIFLTTYVSTSRDVCGASRLIRGVAIWSTLVMMSVTISCRVSRRDLDQRSSEVMGRMMLAMVLTLAFLIRKTRVTIAAFSAFESGNS